ncbi:MAG: hydrogenase maturation protease [Natronomonas sp.]
MSGRDAESASESEESETVSGRILVACMGNILRGDDGFGVAVAEALEERTLPSSVDVTEVGISGVSMAQDLLDGYDAMVLVDAMEGGEEPGTLYVERAEVPDLDQYSRREIGSFAVDMHQTDPAKILVLGESLGVLPDPTVLVGCEPLATDDLEDSLSGPVREAVPRAADHIETVIEELRALDGEPPQADRD